MSYSAPSVGSAGLTIPSYNDILQYLLDQFRNIYGQTVYLGNDSADFQFIAVIALALRDAMQTIQLDFSNRSPNYAVGVALDSLVKLNGISRKTATFSSCQVVITGTPGTEIDNGVIQDTVFNLKWSLPTPIIIPPAGNITVSAICQTSGSFNVLAGNLTIIVTPVAGWISVTNTSPSTPGQPIETDSQLRARQAISVALPSTTLLAGTIAAIAATLGVTRYNVLENFTNATDANGNPAHSVTAVVEGGLDADIATAIFNNRGIGPLTNGTTTVNITDENTGIVMPISFLRPTYVPIYVALGIHPLAGYTSVITDQIRAAIVAYLNSLQIGETLTISGLYGAAMQVTPNISLPLFSVQSLKAGIAPAPTGVVDIAMLFNKVTQGVLANVTTTIL